MTYSPSTTPPIYHHCVWYAFGRLDAGDKLKGSAFDFGEYFVSLLNNGSGGMIPSVQSAFKTWNEGS